VYRGGAEATVTTAAIYARKSTQQDLTDDAKSVARQIEHARAYATRKGWTVSDEHVFVDDGISGAEFDRRPGFQRLMKAVTGTPRPFDALVMSEESRLGRDAVMTMAALQRMVQAGVRVWLYFEDRELVLGSMAENTMTFLRAEFAAEERRKAAQPTYDALARKARAGHVTGGLVFGYDNVPVLGPDGRKSHVERVINEPQAALVREIFDRYVSGWGYARITKALNAAGAPAPRPTENKPAGWRPSSVRSILLRDLYRGVVTWNRSQKRDKWASSAKERAPRASG
jgi:DNA invertase Pin-like site-specific DNA recombinase